MELKKIFLGNKGMSYGWVIPALIAILVFLSVQQIQYPVLNGIINGSALKATDPLYASQQSTTATQVNIIGMEAVIGIVMVMAIVLGVLLKLGGKE